MEFGFCNINITNMKSEIKITKCIVKFKTGESCVVELITSAKDRESHIEQFKAIVPKCIKEEAVGYSHFIVENPIR